MRVTQKIVVGTISINSVQNSSIVQIGSSGMIQSQTESYGGNGHGNGNISGSGVSKGTGTVQSAMVNPPVIPSDQTFEQQTKSILNGSLQGTPLAGEIPPYMYGPTGPLGPVGGIGVRRNPTQNEDS